MRPTTRLYSKQKSHTMLELERKQEKRETTKTGTNREKVENKYKERISENPCVFQNFSTCVFLLM